MACVNENKSPPACKTDFASRVVSSVKKAAGGAAEGSAGTMLDGEDAGALEVV
jgi:hypothetical protein